jgi:hypothetical protein
MTRGFEAATIKQNKGGDPRQGARLLPGGRIEVINLPLRMLVGDPGFDAASGQPLRLIAMLKSLIEQRFKCRCTQTRETCR